MPIPEGQLQTWSHQGSIQQSSATYATIKRTLASPGTPYAAQPTKVFLQGSYCNDTNIFAESDIDVVIRYENTYFHDIADLPPLQQGAFNRSWIAATYKYDDFKRDVVSTLRGAYGNDVTVCDKAISIAASGSRRKADVIASVQFRRYRKFNSYYDQDYVLGLCFFTSSGQQIVNYPEQHSTNLTTRHQLSGNRLKPFVRVLKNLRGVLDQRHTITRAQAPSYFIEGLLYNVPAAQFASTLQQTFSNVFRWLREEADPSTFVCANEQYYLVRDGDHNCWPLANYERFLNSAMESWNTW
jgi:hypothetical protein